MVERLREKLSTESVADRIARMLAPLEKAAGDSGEPSATGDAGSAATQAKRRRSRRRS